MSDSCVVMWTSEWVTVEGTIKVSLPDGTSKEIPKRIAKGDINPESRFGKKVLRRNSDGVS